jgi:transcriptional regulator with XRE-family HTH domain
MRNLNLIGPQVRKLRNQMNWTQEQLAGALQRAGFDVSRSGLAKIESRMVWVADHELFYFTKVFRVSLEQLFPPINPQDPLLYEDLERWMNRRF